MKQNDFYEVNGCIEHLELEVSESGFRTYKFPKKVTVPKFVAEWIKKYRLSHALEDLYIKQTETIHNITVEHEKPNPNSAGGDGK